MRPYLLPSSFDSPAFDCSSRPMWCTDARFFHAYTSGIVQYVPHTAGLYIYCCHTVVCQLENVFPNFDNTEWIHLVGFWYHAASADIQRAPTKRAISFQYTQYIWEQKYFFFVCFHFCLSYWKCYKWKSLYACIPFRSSCFFLSMLFAWKPCTQRSRFEKRVHREQSKGNMSNMRQYFNFNSVKKKWMIDFVCRQNFVCQLHGKVEYWWAKNKRGNTKWRTQT